MKIVFFGTSSFAILPLLSLAKSDHKITAVITQPDKRSGRGLVKSFSPVKLIANKYDLPLYQSPRVSNGDFVKTLEKFKADIFVVVSFGQLLSKDVLSIPKTYSINIHPSLLPKYRGASPINWAILNGETTTGLTIFKMNENMDAGDIIIKEAMGIDENDNALGLGEKLSKLGSELLIKALALIEKKEDELTPQDDAEASCAPKLKKTDGAINWNNNTKKIHNTVRGVVPWPTAYTKLEGKLIKIWKTKMIPTAYNDKADPGTILKLDNDGIIVATSDGALAICEMQEEAGKKMSAAAYCRGHKISSGKKFS